MEIGKKTLGFTTINKQINVRNKENKGRESGINIAFKDTIAAMEENEKHSAQPSNANKDFAFQNFDKEQLLEALNIAKIEIKKAEEKTSKVKHLYDFISQVNRTIVHLKDEKTLFYHACKIACDYGKFEIAWIGLFNNFQKNITLVEQSGLSEAQKALFIDEVCEKNGPQDYVLRNGKPFVCNDIEHEFGFENWEAFMTKRGIQSCVVLPIRKSGNIIGTINLFAAELNFAGTEEIAMLEELTAHISIALDNFEKTKKHEEAENLIIKNENRLRALVNNGADAVVIISPAGQILYASPPVERILGYTVEEVLQIDMFSLVHPDDLAKVEVAWEQVIASRGMPILGTTSRVLHKNGTWRWLEGTLTNLIHDPSVNGIVDNFRDVTEKKQAEEALLLTQFAIDNAGDAIFWMSSDARIVNVNEAACKMLGYSRSEMLSLSVPDFDPDYDAKRWSSHFAELRLKGSLFFETAQKTKDGCLIPVEIRANYIKYGNLELNCAFSRDISERKRVEENLIQSEEQYRQIAETAQEGIWLIDEYDCTNFVNKKMCEIVEYEEDELMGEKVYHFMNAESRKKSLEQIERRKLGMTEIHDSVLVTKSGKEIIVNISTNPILDKSGKYKGALAMMTDITERKKGEEDLKHSENRFREFFESAPETIAIFDVGTFTFMKFNDNAVKLFKYPTEELLKKGPIEISPKFQPDGSLSEEKAVEYTLKAIEGQKPVFEWLFIDADEKEILCEVRLSTLTNVGSHQLICSIIDISERKSAELLREKISAEIVQRNNDLEQFSYIISHNLRAPVANIMGLSEAVQEENLSFEEKKEILTGLTSSIQKLDAVIADLNIILQAKRELTLKKELVTFSKLKNDIYSSIENLIEKENAVFKCDFTEIDEMLTLKTYLYSIFYNLISNSLKYRQPNIAPIIEIKSSRLKNKILLEFKDNGMGIDLKKKGDQVFKLYKRFHTASAEGKGMGLYMVKTQVEAIGGKISIESEVNKGTTFTIEFEN